MARAYEKYAARVGLHKDEVEQHITRLRQAAKSVYVRARQKVFGEPLPELEPESEGKTEQAPSDRQAGLKTAKAVGSKKQAPKRGRPASAGPRRKIVWNYAASNGIRSGGDLKRKRWQLEQLCLQLDQCPLPASQKYSEYKNYSEIFEKAQESKSSGEYNDDYWAFDSLVDLLVCRPGSSRC